MVAPFNTANAFDLSHETKLTCHMGQLVPVMCEEVCPGDVFRWKADVLLRLMPMLAPMMHDVRVSLHSFFVPSRILFDGFENFVSGGKDGNDSQEWPHVVAPDTTGFTVGSLADYLGCPTGVPGLEVSALPFRAYQKIYNDWFRDENLIDEVSISTSAGADSTTSTSLQRRAWAKDYFTTSSPFVQGLRGGPTYLPLGVSCPVVGTGMTLGLTNGVDNVGLTNTTSPTTSVAVYKDAYGATVGAKPLSSLPTATGSLGLVGDGAKSGIIADLRTALAASIDDIRTAFQINLFKQLNGFGGVRYVEFLLNHFGVRSSDARLQRSEFLGGGKMPISIGEVLQTSSTDNTSPQGNMAGRGVIFQQVPSFTKTFEEFGYVICLLSVMPRGNYQQGLRRMWTRKSRWDYPLPVFAHLGNQKVKNEEIYAQAPTVVQADGVTPVNEGTFGYQDRYEELRRVPNTVHGQFKTSLNFWHLGRIFDSLPQLNQQFIECNPSKRVFAVTSSDEDECLVQVHHDLKAIRRFPKNGKPGLIDHY